MTDGFQKIGEGLYYDVYQISDTRVFKKEKSYWRKQKMWVKWLLPAYFLINMCKPSRYKRHLKDSKSVALRAPALLGNPVFTEGYDYEQDKVLSLEEFFAIHSEDENKEIIERYIALTYATWEHGFSDIVYNFTFNCGVDAAGAVVLHDFNEITFDVQRVLGDIRRKFWLSQSSFTSMPQGQFKEYVKKRLASAFTKEALEARWRKDTGTGFWKKLKKPFFVLAPMADVTDAAFRRIIAKYSRHGDEGGGPDVFWTEFVAADGLAHPAAREKLLLDLAYTEGERPIVAQLFGSNPDTMRSAAALCRELGFDGIDINMGCPDKSIEKQGAGAACMRNPKRAKEVIRAAKMGAQGLPVSVKTRIGYNRNELETWLPALLEEDLAAITIHARTRKEMSKVPARWEHVKRAVEIRNAMGKETLIIGNGDVRDLVDAKEKVAQTSCDGVMLGRAIFGNPWLFDSKKNNVSIREKLEAMIEHTKLFEALLGAHKNFAIMKKHYKAYVNGFDGAKELRMELMEAHDAQEVERLVRGFLER